MSTNINRAVGGNVDFESDLPEDIAGEGEGDASVTSALTGEVTPIDSRLTELPGGGERREYSDGTSEQVDDLGNYTFTDADGTTLQLNVDGGIVRRDLDGGGVLHRDRDGTFGAGGIAAPIEDLGTGDAVNGAAVDVLTGGDEANGSRYSEDGSFEVRRTDGSVEHADAGGTYRREGVDGSTLEVGPDGSFFHLKADGSAVERDADGQITRRELNADGDVTFYLPDGDIRRQNANGEFIGHDAETGETVFAAQDPNGNGFDAIGAVNPDGTTASVIADFDGNGVPETPIGGDIALGNTEFSELENPDYLTDNLTQDEANAALETGELPDGVEVFSSVKGGATVYTNRDGDLTTVMPNGDVFRYVGAGGGTISRVDGVVSFQNIEGTSGTVAEDGEHVTIEVDGRVVAEGVPLQGQNVDYLLDFDGTVASGASLGSYTGPGEGDAIDTEPTAPEYEHSGYLGHLGLSPETVHYNYAA